jgi:hypothetical protein
VRNTPGLTALGAVVALSLAGLGLLASTPVANAALPDREPVQITADKACGAVTLTFVNPNTAASATSGFRWNAVAGKVATADGARTGLVTVSPTKTVKETIRFDEDEFGGEAAVTVGYAFGPNSDIQPIFKDVYPVDTDCAVPGTTTPPPPPVTCDTTKAGLDVALKAVLEFGDNAYPGDKRPVLADLTPTLLKVIKADPDLGGGGQAEVQVALDAIAAKDKACGTTTPPGTTPPVTTPATTTTQAPPAETCQTATAKLGRAISETITYNANAYPGDKVPTLAQVTPDFLKQVKADPDLGADGQAEVQAAIDAFALKDKLCAPAGGNNNGGSGSTGGTTGGNAGTDDNADSGSNGGGTTVVSDDSDDVLPSAAAETGGYDNP